MPLATSEIQAYQDGHGYFATSSGLQLFYEGTDGTTWFRNHGPAGLRSCLAVRFAIPASVRDLIIAGTGITDATVTFTVTHDGTAGTIFGDVLVGPDQGTMTTANGPKKIYDDLDALPADYAHTTWDLPDGLGTGAALVSPNFATAFDDAVADAVYDASEDAYIVHWVWKSGATDNRFYRVASMENATLDAAVLDLEYDAPGTDAAVTPAAAQAQATGGVGYFQWTDLNYDRDGSRTGNNFRRYLDVYEPWTVSYDDTAGRRAVAYLHGGAYFEGNENTLTAQHRNAALARGYTVAAIRYSLSDQDTANDDNDYTHPMAVQDVGMALTWLTDSDGNNPTPGAPEGIADIDPEWIILEAYSAGAHLALGYALTYDDSTVYQWDYTGGASLIPRRAAEPSSSPDFTFTQGRTNQPRPRGLYLWDGPVDLADTVIGNNVMYGPVQAFYGGNGDPDYGQQGAGWANAEADYNDLITGAAGTLWEGLAHGDRLHGMPIGYIEARWGGGRWAPPIRDYGDGGETVVWWAGIGDLEDALQAIGYPTNNTGDGTYRGSIGYESGAWSNAANGLNTENGLSHWQSLTWAAPAPTYPHDVVYLYDNYGAAYPWQLWHDEVEASADARPAAATAAATAGTVAATVDGGGDNDVTLTAAVARAKFGNVQGNRGYWEWTSIIDGADEDLVDPTGEYSFDEAYTTDGATIAVDVSQPLPAYNRWLRHRYVAGSGATARVSVDFGPRPSNPVGLYPFGLYGRVYLRVPALLPSDVFVADIHGVYGLTAGWKLKTSGALVSVDELNDEVGTLATLSPATTYRLEWHYDADPQTLEARLYELHGDTPIGTDSRTPPADILGRVEFGGLLVSNPGATVDVYYSEAALSTIDWIGPVELVADTASPAAATAAATAQAPTVDTENDADVTLTAGTAAATAQTPTVTVDDAAAPPSSSATATAGTVTVDAVSDDTASPAAGTATATGQAPTAVGQSDNAETLTAAVGTVSATAGTVDAGSDREAAPAAASSTATGQAPTVEAESAGQATPTAAAAVALAGTVSARAVSSPTASPAAAVAPATGQAPTVTVADTVALTAATATATAEAPTVDTYSDSTADPSAATGTATGRPPTVDTENDTEAGPAAASSTATASAPAVTVADLAELTAATATATAGTVTVDGVSDDLVTPSAATATATAKAPTVDTDSDTEAGPDGALATATAGTALVDIVQDADETVIRALAPATGQAPTVTVDDLADLVAAVATATAQAPTVDAGSSAEASPAAAVAQALAGTALVELIQDAAGSPEAAVALALAASPATSTVLLTIMRRYRRPTMKARNVEPGRS